MRSNGAQGGCSPELISQKADKEDKTTGYDIQNLLVERVLWEQGCYEKNGRLAHSAPLKLVVVKSLDPLDARDFP